MIAFLPRSWRTLAAAAALVIVPRWTTASFAAESVWPGAEWAKATPAEAGMVEARLLQARDYALTGGGSGVVARHGKVVLTWGDQTKLYDLKSSTKSFGVTVLGLALKDGKVHLDDPAITYHPRLATPPESNRPTGWIGKITLRQLANQCAGFEKPGGYGKLLFPPGTRFRYSDAGPNWLAECLTLAYRRDLNDLMFERVFTPLGITSRDIVWRENIYRPHEINGIERREFGAGFSANVGAMARIGYLYLREGRWRDRQILPRSFVDEVRHPAPALAGLPEDEPTHGNASEHYSLLWWDNGDGAIPGLPRDAYWSSGLYDSYILVIPSLDIVAARAGRGWPRTSGENYYDAKKPFFEPIAAAVTEFGKTAANEREPARFATEPTSWSEEFSHGLVDWWIEGGERVEVEDGRLSMRADDRSRPGGTVATAWCRRPLPPDFELEVDAHVVSASGGNNNMNLFFCFTDPTGRDLEETKGQRRHAEYRLYHQLDGYIVTFLNEGGVARARLRRDPGFKLLAETHSGECRAGVTYHLSVRKHGGEITFSVDGRELLHAVDPAPWRGGHLGLRTYRTQLWWDNLRVRAL